MKWKGRGFSLAFFFESERDGGMKLRVLLLLPLLVGVAGCGSTPKKTTATEPIQDRQCGRFCAELDRCLEDDSDSDSDLRGRLCELARCESGCRPHARSPAGYEGAFQFDRATWRTVCGPIFSELDRPSCRPSKMRNDLCCAAVCTAKIISREGARRWPTCGR